MAGRWEAEGQCLLRPRSIHCFLPKSLNFHWIFPHWVRILLDHRAIRIRQGFRSWGWWVRLRMPQTLRTEPILRVPWPTYPSPTAPNKLEPYRRISVYWTFPGASWVNSKPWSVRPRWGRCFWVECRLIFLLQIGPDCEPRLVQIVKTRCPLPRIWFWFPCGGKFPRRGGRDSYRN